MSLADNNTIDLICNSEEFARAKTQKWIVVYPSPENQEYIEDYQEQGFNIIEADTMELIEYLYEMEFVDKGVTSSKYRYGDLFPKNYISEKLEKVSVRRPVVDFFAGAEPQISDVLSGNVTRISFFDEILNKIITEDTVLITGIPGCGKSTLLLQLAFSKEVSGIKFWFNNLTKQEAERLAKTIQGEKGQFVVFIDNLYNNMEAFKVLRERPKIKLVLAERALNFDYIKRSFNIDSREIIDISNLNAEDIQTICKSMNRPSEDAVKLISNNENVSLLEIVFYAATSTLINERIKDYINDLRAFEDSELKINLLELFALINYTSYCGVPCSMDQYAIFLQRKKQYDLAWSQIDQAYTESEKKVFTIANTHAVILFEMNIEAEASTESELALLKETMQKSFSTLEYCITQDVRINYHVLVYSRNAIRYYERFGVDLYTRMYIESSLKQVEDVLNKDEYMYIKIKKQLQSLSRELMEIKSRI